MNGLSARLTRAGYLLRRLRESPLSFLVRKASIGLAKRYCRGTTIRGAARGRRFSDGYEECLPRMRRLATAIRKDTLDAIQDLGLTENELLGQLIADFDAHRWRCLGYGTQPLDIGAWHEDGFHGHTWPRDYFADIDFVKSGTRCDVKVPWEKSRMQWLVCAALAGHIDSNASRRADRLERVRALFLDWVADNPYCIGVNWVSAMEVAIRSVNLMTAFVYLENQVEDDDLRALLCSAGEHLRYLRQFPEISDIPGNHHLATELGIYFLEAWRSGDDSSTEISESLLQACEAQFTADGLHIEFSPMYHRLSLDMLVTGLAMVHRLAPECSRKMTLMASKGVEICEMLSNSAGQLPIIGDNDSGSVLSVGQPTRKFGHFYALLARRAQSVPISPGEAVLGAMLLGLSGAQLSCTEPEQTPASTNRIGPFVILGGSREKLIIRAGELGLMGRASHDHDDQLSFWYSYDEWDVIVEGGCSPYTRSLEERLASLSSLAHNVISAVGHHRFIPGPGSVCSSVRGGPRAAVDINQEDGAVVVSAQLIRGESEAFVGCPEEHERTFLMPGNGILRIQDRFKFSETKSFEYRLHLPTEARVSDVDEGTGAAIVRVGPLRVHIRVSGTTALNLQASRYVQMLEYGAGTSAPCLIIRGSATDPVELLTQVSVAADCRVSSPGRVPQ